MLHLREEGMRGCKGVHAFYRSIRLGNGKMARMEGFLMNKGWFNNWKMRYVTCSEHILTISKTKGDDKNRAVFNVMDCEIKRIDAKRWNKKFAFRLKIAGKRLYFAADDEKTLQKWMAAIRGRVARASLLGANAVRCTQADKRRPSTMATLPRLDYGESLAFEADTFVDGYQAAVRNSEDAEAQFKFAEICGEFLAIAHSQSQTVFQSNRIRSIPGLSVNFVEPSERKMYLKRMKGIASLCSKKDPDILIPLQCLIDFGGRTLFFEIKVAERTKELSETNLKKLADLGLDSSNIDAWQDNKGRLWIMDTGSALETHVSEDEIQKFVAELDSMEMFVFDSQSLSEAMRARHIPVSLLPKLAEMSKIPAVRVLLQTEMIARVCKSLISTRLMQTDSPAWAEEIWRSFDIILGNSRQSIEFWEKELAPAVAKKFGVELTRDTPLLHMAQLFFSLQFHTGADFKDISDYDFTKEHPLSPKHLSSINSVPHHFLVEICTSLREIAEDPYGLLVSGFLNQASLAFNNKVSMYQSLYGDENIFVATGLSQLSQAYSGIGDNEKAELCARGAIGAGRHFHAALIPAYVTLITTCRQDEIELYSREASEIVNFQLSESHWFQSDVYMAAAAAYQMYGELYEAAKYAQKAADIVHPLLGPRHPKTARCLLLQGKIQGNLGQYAVARPLIQQALYIMTASFSEDSPQAAECQYELADVLLDSGKSDEAEQASLKSLRIREANYESDNSLVLASVQQLASIYDTMENPEKAFPQYRIILNFLKSLEDESIFDEMVKLLRNILCLFFRTLPGVQRRLVNQLKHRQVDNTTMKHVFQKLIENDPVDQTKSHISKYQDTGDPQEFEALACAYHIAHDELSDLSWLEDH